MFIETYHGDTFGLHTFISERPGITHLSIAESGVTGLDCLRSCQNLQYLDAMDCVNLESVDGLDGLKNLFYANLRGTWIKDLTVLQDCSGLKHLDLSNTPVSSIRGLKGLNNLEYLNLSNTKVADLSSLKSCGSLRYLDVRNTPASLLNTDFLRSRNVQVFTAPNSSSQPHNDVCGNSIFTPIPVISVILPAPESASSPQRKESPPHWFGLLLAIFAVSVLFLFAFSLNQSERRFR